MDDRAKSIQRCIDEKLKYQIESEAARTWDYEAQSTGNFSRWVKILEVGTFNPIERIAINAALYSHKRMATKKIIYDTLLQGGYARSNKEESRESGDCKGEIEEILKDWNKEDLCK